MDEDLTTVATFHTVAEAQLAKERLGMEDIEAYLADEMTAGLLPLMGSSLGAIRLQVATSDVERAKEILSI